MNDSWTKRLKVTRKPLQKKRGYVTNQFVSDTIALLLRFETLFKGMPKSRDDCNQLEPLQVFRKVQTASAIRSEILSLAGQNYHFETSFRAEEVITPTLNRMTVFTKPVVNWFAMYDRFSISYQNNLVLLHQSVFTDLETPNKEKGLGKRN